MMSDALTHADADASAAQHESVRKGDIIKLSVDKAAFEGRAIGRLGGLVVFVEGAVPGDVVTARVFKKKKQMAEARVVDLLQASPHRVRPMCSHFDSCGECSW